MENSNSTPQDEFLYYIDQAIETGDTKFIDFAIKNFGYIGNQYIIWANQIKETLLVETFEEITL